MIDERNKAIEDAEGRISAYTKAAAMSLGAIYKELGVKNFRLTSFQKKQIKKALLEQKVWLNQKYEEVFLSISSVIAGMGYKITMESFFEALKGAPKLALSINEGQIVSAWEAELFQSKKWIWHRKIKGRDLSSRIWKYSKKNMDIIDRIIKNGLRDQLDPVKIAKAITQYVDDGAKTLASSYPNMMARMNGRIPKNLCHEALQLVRTEMAEAYKQGMYTAGRFNPAYLGIKWSLSNTHPVEDICDTYATQDLYGQGPGVYPQGFEPSTAHPNCLCTQRPVTIPKDQLMADLKNYESGRRVPYLNKFFDFYTAEVAA